MKKSFIGVLSLALCLAVAGMGCDDDQGVAVTRVKSSRDIRAKKSTIDKLPDTVDGMSPVQASEQVVQARNPFRGFSDTILAEAMMRQRIKEEHLHDVQLPEQLYPTRDYKVISVITGTADPKAYVVDPSGNRFILRRGSLIGNNNGSISSIRREVIEVYERVADQGQYIELPLFDKPASDNKSIQISIQ